MGAIEPTVTADRNAIDPVRRLGGNVNRSRGSCRSTTMVPPGTIPAQMGNQP